jgi:hypothetical protein
MFSSIFVASADGYRSLKGLHAGPKNCAETNSQTFVPMK